MSVIYKPKEPDMPFYSVQYEISGLTFVLTCYQCPEQYDVFDADGNQVGFVHLRNGLLYCDYPEVFGETIYEHRFYLPVQGSFIDEEQRDLYLGHIADAINNRIAKEKRK